MPNTQKNVLESKVSFQNNTWSSLSKEIAIAEVLKQINSDDYLKDVQRLREVLKLNNILN